jgi:hypothetical protein
VVFVALGIAVCSLAQTPAPWAQLQRIGADEPPPVDYSATPLEPDPATRDFFATIPYGPRDFYAKAGAPVVIMITSGHRIADAFGVVNVSPFSGLTSAVTAEQLRDAIAALRAAGGNTLIMPTTANEDYRVLDQAGFRLVTASGLWRFNGVSRPPEEVEVAFPGDTLIVPWMLLDATKWVDTHNLHPRLLRDRRGAPVLRIGDAAAD